MTTSARSTTIAALLLIALASPFSAARQSVIPLRPSVPAAAGKAATPAPAPTPPAAQPVPAPGGSPAPAAAAAAPAAPDTHGFSADEIKRLRATFDTLSPDEKAQMRAFYQDMDVDLDSLLGLKAAPPPAAAISLPDAVRALDFNRKPEAVLAARSQLGFAASLMPDRSNAEALAKWLHLNIMAGEWDVLPQLLPLLSAEDATAIYSHILRSTNQGTQGLLPEEVLALADACPGEMADWMLDVLSQMLKGSAERYGTGQFLTRIRGGTHLFGPQDDASRRRTVRLLVGAGLALDAYQFLPPLDEARQRGDARVIYAHARYHLDLVEGGRAGAEDEEQQRAQAWDGLCEVSLMENADVDLRKDAMRRAIDLLPSMPPAKASAWLGTVFANRALGPAALEVVALKAMAFRDKKTDAAQRAQGLATMKSAVDILLSEPDLNMQALRVPLRMLTTALADEVEAVVTEKGNTRGVARETELLFRASPDERWLAAIEPSVAIRGYRACIAIATIADETDVALDVLANAVKRFPDQGVDFADNFLKLWEARLNPKARPEDEMNPWIFYSRQAVPAAPLTRGRQRRNLDRLERLISILDQMGVHARRLPSVTAAFRACHAKTEVFNRDEIVRVFGPLDQISPDAAAALAESMRVGLGGDWRNRQVQRGYGMMRSTAEISDLVEEGYELAIELASRAVELDPESWQDAVLKAALSYDRVQFKQTQQKQDFATYNEYRRQAFAAFEQASHQYAALVSKGLERDNSGVYLRWFSAVLDAGQDTSSSKEEDAAATALTDDQISRIAAALHALPEDAYERHVGAFARDVVDSLPSVPPEKKPAIVRAAVRIVGDLPAGAPLRRLSELYDDLLKNEIRLRITVDGSDSVPAGAIFGATLTLRYTNSVDRETGGFDKYLYQDAYVRIGNQYRSINYQAQLRKGIESALGQSFDVESIGFFEPLTPSRSVKEDGQSGWQEKPMAYILLKAKDPSVDRLPQISFDMHFDDQTGAVTLPILSNSPPVNAAGDAASHALRPAKSLQVQQTVDARRLINNTDDRAVTVEVYAKADGVIPDIRDLLAGLDDALPGYAIAADGIEERPYSVVQSDAGKAQRYYPFGAQPDEKTTYPTADENGIFRLPTERSWLVTFKPTGGAVAKTFTLPRLKDGVEGELVSRSYADLDILKVDSATIAVAPRLSITTKLAGILGLLALAGAAMWLYFRRRKPQTLAVAGFTLPARITPLSTIATLERIRGLNGKLGPGTREAIEKDIATIQRAYFSPEEQSPRPDEGIMRSMLEKWSGQIPVE